MNRFDGKTVLISGGARGIGAESARLMCEAGASVVIGDILDDTGAELVASLSGDGHQARFITLDVTRPDDWDAAVALATSEFGHLDILVNNAGIFLGIDFEDATMDDWNRISAINMGGVFLGAKHCAPALKAAGANSEHGSAIVNLSSIAGLVGAPLDPLYSMTKGGVSIFTKSLALDFARKRARIRVNSVHPGVIDTEMGQQTIDILGDRYTGGDMERAHKASVSRHPIGRLGTVTDIAKAIMYLASDDASFTTGSNMVVDGGLTAA